MAINPETRNPAGKGGGKKGGKKGGRKGGNPFEDVGGAIGDAGGSAAHHGGGSRHNVKKNRKRVRRLNKQITRRENREARRDFRQSQFDQTLTERQEGNEVGYKPTAGDAYGRILEEDIRAAAPDAINEGLAKVNEFAKPIAEGMTWIGGPEVRGGITVLKAIGRIVTRKGAIKTGEKAAVKAAAKEGEKVAVKTGGRAAAKGVSKKEATRTARRTAARGTRKVEKALKKTSKKRVKAKVKQGKPTLKSRAGGAAKRQFKKRRPTITSGRDAIKGALYKKGTQATIAGGVAAGTVAGPAAGILESTGKALEEDPGQTLKTTAQAIPSFVTAPVKIGAAAYQSGKNVVEGNPDPLAPIKAEGEAQLDYYKHWADIAKGDERGEKLVREKYGLTPVLTGALGLHAATRPFRTPKAPREPRVVRVGARPRRVKRLREEAGSTDTDTAAKAQEALMKAERIRDRRARRRRIAREHDVAKRRSEGSFRADMLETGEAGGKSRNFGASMRHLAEVPIDEKGASLADAVQLVHGLGIPLEGRAGRAALIDVRNSLVGPDGRKVPSLNALRAELRTLDPADPEAQKIAGLIEYLETAPSARTTRQVLDALIAHPELLEHPDLLRTEQQLRAIRRDQAEGDLPPDPADRARHVAQARVHGVSTPEERVPMELRHIVRKVRVREVPEDVRRARDELGDPVGWAARHGNDEEAEVVALSPYIKKLKGKPGVTIERPYYAGLDAENPNAPLIVYRDENGDPVGSMLITFEPVFRAGKEVGVDRGKILHMQVFVDPRHRRQGIATKMARAAYEAGIPVHQIGKDELYSSQGAALRAGLLGRGDEQLAVEKTIEEPAFKPKKYQNMKTRLRDEMRKLNRRAKKKEAQATQHPKGSPKREALMAEAEALRQQAQEIKDVIRRPQQARKLEAQAYHATDPVEAENLKQAAQAIRREHHESQQALTDEFHDEMAGVRQEKGLREPIFFHDYSAKDIGEPTRGGKPVNAAGAAKADKIKLGQLREMGLVDESGNSLIESLYRDRANAEMNGYIRRVFETEAEANWLTGPQLRKQMREGNAPAGHSAVPLQDIKRAWARGDWEHALGLIDSAMRDSLSEADFGAKGKKYAWVPTSTLNEVYAQAQQTAGWAQNLRRFGGIQSFLLLGTSPTWAAFQGFATPLILAARHPNPVTWVKAGRDMVRFYKQLSRRERAAFESVVGSNMGDVYQFRNEDFGPTPSNIRKFSDASRVMRKTWSGRLVHNLTRGGGPLIRGVARYENTLRILEGLMEADKLYNRTGPMKFAHSVAGLDAATRKHIDTVSGMSFKERMAYLGDRKNTRELERRVMSTLGDWNSLTAREKTWSGLFIFYPFLRFSLRWMFNTFPKDNSIKAAILLNLAQQNAQEVERMLGGREASFFQTYGLVPIRDSEGDVSGAINLARAAPGSNALIEAVGGENEINATAFGRVFQPALSALLLQGGAGLNPFTGEQEATSAEERALMAARQILGLSPVGRAFAVPALEESSEFLKPSPTAEFFRTLDGRSAVEKAFVPDFLTTDSFELAKAQSGELLDTMDDAPTPEEIGQMADYIAARYPGLNEAQLRERPEIQEFIQRARKAEKASNIWGRVLEDAGVADSEEQERNFGNIFNLVDPIGGFNQKPIDKRTEAQRVRFLKRQRGMSGKEIERRYPDLPQPYEAKIEALRRSGMTDKQIAAKYPRLRKHLPSLQSGGSSWGGSSWGGSSWGSGSGWGSGSNW